MSGPPATSLAAELQAFRDKMEATAEEVHREALRIMARRGIVGPEQQAQILGGVWMNHVEPMMSKIAADLLARHVANCQAMAGRVSARLYADQAAERAGREEKPDQ